MSTHEEVDGLADLPMTSHAGPREWQSPLLFFAIVLALWVAIWFGIDVLV